jgi:8-oxo-dGTP pyrophosphatase MutT (NUDIX family)
MARPQGRFTRQFSAGGVIYRESQEGIEVALGLRMDPTGEPIWCLPKGLIEPGEKAEVTALREVREETGLQGEIEKKLGEVQYWYHTRESRVFKKVVFYLLRYREGDVAVHDHELAEVHWLPLAEAIARATFKSEREILEKAAAQLKGRFGRGA